MLPHMDSDGLIYFKNQIAQSSVFLEYGCGGSTIYALNQTNIQKVISVDTDNAWISKVNQQANTNKLSLTHIDLGEVGDWGTPKTTTNFKDFYRYSTTPWQVTKQNNYNVNLVFIDGRFRVSCFLYSLIAANEGTIIIFDDYYDRPYYFVVEEFCQPIHKAGRAGVFKVHKHFDTSKLVMTYGKYISNWA